jgi:hypothetical protein
MKKGLSIQEKYKIAKEAENTIIEYKRIAGVSFIYIGKELKKIKEENLYKYLGQSPEYESFENYVNSLNLDLRKAYYLIQIYSTFVLKYGYKPEELSDTNWTALRSILPVTNEDNYKDMVEKARLLTRSHLEMEVKSLKSGLTSMEDLESHKHEWEYINYYKCKICGEHSKIKPQDGKII